MLFRSTTAPALTREQLLAAAKAAGSPELSVPRRIRHVAAIPLLGSGKTDYVTLKRMAEESAGDEGGKNGGNGESSENGQSTPSEPSARSAATAGA